MKKESLLRKIAPCGLVCFTCAAAKNGVIRHHARELLKPKWLKANARMKEIGTEAYFNEVKDTSHYAAL